MKHAASYDEHLNRVSRSFAFCIKRLPQPLQSEVALTYLICRLLDTIEDASWPSPEVQEEHFDRFDERLQNPTSRVNLPFDNLVSPLPSGELKLIDFQDALFADFHSLPPASRDILFSTIQSMSRGMRHFALKRPENVLRLKSLLELNVYCFFVAGVIGEGLTLLFSKHEPTFSPSKDNLELSVHFGLFLQIINILKDYRSDEAEGRFFIHDKGVVLASLKTHGYAALKYLLQIPSQQVGYRIFCAWSLFLGLFTLPRLVRTEGQDKISRPSRLQTWNFLRKVESRITDDAALMELFDELMRRADLPTVLPDLDSSSLSLQILRDPTHKFSWVKKCYMGRLSLELGPIFGVSFH